MGLKYLPVSISIEKKVFAMKIAKEAGIVKNQ